MEVEHKRPPTPFRPAALATAENPILLLSDSEDELPTTTVSPQKSQHLRPKWIFCCESIKFNKPKTSFATGPHCERIAQIAATINSLQSQDIYAIPQIRDAGHVQMTLGIRYGTLIKVENILKPLFPTRYFFWYKDVAGKDVFEEFVGNDFLIGTKFEERDVFVTGGCAPEKCATSFVCRLMGRKRVAVERKGKEKVEVGDAGAGGSKLGKGRVQLEERWRGGEAVHQGRVDVSRVE
jgi:hypothetical protein